MRLMKVSRALAVGGLGADLINLVEQHLTQIDNPVGQRHGARWLAVERGRDRSGSTSWCVAI